MAETFTILVMATATLVDKLYLMELRAQEGLAEKAEEQKPTRIMLLYQGQHLVDVGLPAQLVGLMGRWVPLFSQVGRDMDTGGGGGTSDGNGAHATSYGSGGRGAGKNTANTVGNGMSGVVVLYWT